MASSSCSSPSSSSKMQLQFKCSTPKPQPMDETTKEDVDGEQLLDWHGRILGRKIVGTEQWTDTERTVAGHCALFVGSYGCPILANHHHVD
uniref:Ubiquitin-fold modifier 1 n=1 Tax=Globodera pallida TaxID=36090 RepID=A0A183BPF6_GLOPA